MKWTKAAIAKAKQTEEIDNIPREYWDGEIINSKLGEGFKWNKLSDKEKLAALVYDGKCYGEIAWQCAHQTKDVHLAISAWKKLKIQQQWTVCSQWNSPMIIPVMINALLKGIKS